MQTQPQKSTITIMALAVATILLVAVGAYLYAQVQETGSQDRSLSSEDRSLGSEVASYSASLISIQSQTSSESVQPAKTLSNESFQLVDASVGVGDLGSTVVVNATYRDYLSSPTTVELNGSAYAAQNSYEPVTGGSPIGPICCPLISSYSQNSTTVSGIINASVGAQFSSDLSYTGLSAGTYLVKVFVSSLNGSLLSPIADVYLEVTVAINDLYASACGGQEAATDTYFDQTNDLVYVVNSGLYSVSVVNATTDKLVATISLASIIGQNVGNLEFYLYDPGNHQLYLGTIDTDVLFAIDTETNFLAGEIATGHDQLVYDPANGRIFGINFADSLVYVIDGSTDKLIAKITGIMSPGGILYDPKNSDIYVQAYNGTVFAIDGNNYHVVARISNPSPNLGSLVYDNDNGLFYTVEGNAPATVLMFNATTNTLLPNNVTLGPASVFGDRTLFYDPFNKDIYFYEGPGTFATGGNLSAFDTTTNTVVATVPVASLNEGTVAEDPSFLYDQSNGNIYATEVTDRGAVITLLEISAETNQIIFQTSPPGLPLNDWALDSSNNSLFAGYGSAVYLLNPSSNQTSTLALGTCSYQTLLP